MSPSSDGNEFDRIEQHLRWTLSKVGRDVEDAVRRVDSADADELAQQIDGDIEELGDALGSLRTLLHRRAASQPIALSVAVSSALDRVLGEVETPLSITSSVPADLPLPAMSRSDLTTLSERILRLLTRVALAGDELRISAALDDDLADPERVVLHAELRPFESERLPEILDELERSSETVVDFVVEHGGRMAVERGGAATIRLALPSLVSRA